MVDLLLVILAEVAYLAVRHAENTNQAMTSGARVPNNMNPRRFCRMLRALGRRSLVLREATKGGNRASRVGRRG